MRNFHLTFSDQRPVFAVYARMAEKRAASNDSPRIISRQPSDLFCAVFQFCYQAMGQANDQTDRILGKRRGVYTNLIAAI